ncbi:MAG: CBS domain-containing protein [Nitrospirales bacterium]|nr:CBS domain-containing protein [Nitrospira sp.]MDR4460154.1 CBS domain-containing protein [Nitrospirales bacterium]
MDITSAIVRRVVTINENRSVFEAAKLMTEEFIGALVVTNTTGFRGLLTERDMIKHVVGKGKDPEKVKIKDTIRLNPLRVSPSVDANHCLNLMKEHHCRHLLVYDGEEFIGIVSVRDLVVLLLEEKEELIRQLERYITS